MSSLLPSILSAPEIFSREDGRCQAGVAMLDTRSFTAPSQIPSIPTFNFAIGSTSDCDKCNRRFLFGKTVNIQKGDLHQNLESLISRERNNILMGHDMREELRIPRMLNLDFKSTFVGRLDTQRPATRLMYSPDAPAKLRNFLRDLQCPYQNLHNAGNDAHLTLRALLLLAIRGYPKTRLVHNDEIRKRIVLLKNISQSSIQIDDEKMAEEYRRKQAEKEENRHERLKAKEFMRIVRRERKLQREATAIEQKRAERKLKRECDLENNDCDEGVVFRVQELMNAEG